MSKTATKKTPRGNTALPNGKVARRDTARDTALQTQALGSELPLAFGSWPALLSFGVLCLLVLFAPLALSGFLPGNYLDQFVPPSLFGPLTALSLLATITACVCLLMALRSGDVSSATSATSLSTRLLTWMRRFPIAALLCAFFAWSVLSAATTVYRHDTLLELTRIGCCVLWFVVAVALLRDNTETLEGDVQSRIIAARQMTLLLFIIIGTLLVSAPAFMQLLRGVGGQFGSFSNNNFFANYGVMAVPLALAWTMQTAVSKRDSSQFSLFVAAGGAATLVLLGGVFSTTSKGGFLSLLVGLMVFAIAVAHAQGAAIRQWGKANRVLVAIGLVLFLVVGGAVTARTIGPRLLAARDGDNNSTMFRVYTWQSTAHMALARPVLGWGPGSFPSAYGQFAIAGTTRHAHQVWLQIAAENGIVASLLLLGACVAATARGWRALKHTNWPLAAGALAAMWAFIAHGFTDYGWGTTSIALLFLLTLASIQSANADTTTSTQDTIEAPQSGLRWPWLCLTLLVALSAWWMQRVVSAADSFSRANAMWSSGSPTMALQLARDATQQNPLSARWRTQLGSLLEGTNNDADEALSQAVQLQPTQGQLWRRWAEYRVARPANTSDKGPSTEELFNRAVQLDRNSTSIRLARAQWLLSQNDPRAWNDLQYIVRLRDEPYGRYPALADLVDLNFARASIALARRALQNGDKAAAQQLIERSRSEITKAREKEEYWRQINTASGGAGEFADTRDLDEIEAQLNTLEEQLK